MSKSYVAGPLAVKAAQAVANNFRHAKRRRGFVPLRLDYFHLAEDCTAGLLLSILACQPPGEHEIRAEDFYRFGFRAHSLARARKQLLKQKLIATKQGRYGIVYTVLVAAPATAQHIRWRRCYVELAGSLKGSVLLAVLADETERAFRSACRPRSLAELASTWLLSPGSVRSAASELRRRELLCHLRGHAWAYYYIDLKRLIMWSSDEKATLLRVEISARSRVAKSAFVLPRVLYSCSDEDSYKSMGGAHAAEGDDMATRNQAPQFPVEPERRKSSVLQFQRPTSTLIPPREIAPPKPPRKKSERQRLLEWCLSGEEPLVKTMMDECRLIAELAEPRDLRDMKVFLVWLRSAHSDKFTTDDLGNGIKRFALWYRGESNYGRGRRPRPRDYRQLWDEYRDFRAKQRAK